MSLAKLRLITALGIAINFWCGNNANALMDEREVYSSLRRGARNESIIWEVREWFSQLRAYVSNGRRGACNRSGLANMQNGCEALVSRVRRLPPTAESQDIQELSTAMHDWRADSEPTFIQLRICGPEVERIRACYDRLAGEIEGLNRRSSQMRTGGSF